MMHILFFFSSRRRHTRYIGDWSSDVCSSDLYEGQPSHPVCHGVGARAHEPPYAHQAGNGTIEAGMVLVEIGRASCRGRVEAAGGAGRMHKHDEVAHLVVLWT